MDAETGVVQRLLDYEEIRALLARYAYGLDFQDWDAVAASFTNDGVYDMHDYFARLGLDTPAARGRDQIVASLQTAAAAAPDLQLQHFLTNVVIELDGDRADTKSYLLVHASDASTSFLTGAVWEDQMVRTGEGWRISYRYLRFVWEDGPPRAVLDAVRNTTDGSVDVPRL